MAPIRVGLIGLSSGTGEKTASAGDGWASSAHLPYLLASPHYEVVALCNSSEASAKTAAQKHGLPASTKAYGSPEDLANDPDVDLVVCCVRVDRHYKLVKASLEKGKNVFVEWPLGANLQQAAELTELANKSGSKTMVGLQARQDPHTQKVRQLVKDGAIGDLLSSTINVNVGFVGDTEPPGIDYMAKKEVGGNLLTIVFGHNVDWVTYALGEFQDFSALLATQWPKTKLLHADGSFDRMIDRETPDHILLQGTLAGSEATVSFALRGGKIMKDSPALTWHIFGTKGEIRITSPNPFLDFATGSEKIELYNHETDEVETIKVSYPEAADNLPNLAKDIGLLYEAFYIDNTEEIPTFKDAVKLHQIIDDMWKSSEQKTSRSKLK